MNPILAGKGVSIERLRAFVAVVEAGSVTVAADRDPNRQSQFSRQIKELEEALGVPLFERINRQLVPTEGGRQLAVMTKSYFAGLAELSQTEAITIGAGESILEEFVFPRVAQMRVSLPGYRFVFEGCSTTEVIERLRSGRIDLGIIRETAATTGLTTQFLAMISYRLVVPRALLSEATADAWQLLRGLPIALLRGRGEFVRSLELLFTKAKVSFKVVAEADTFGALKALVFSGAVAAVLPEQMARSFPPDRFSLVRAKEFDTLNRSMVVASHERKRSVRPLLDQATDKLTRVWAP